MSNLGWHFYKDYFRDIDFLNISSSDIREKVNNILSIKPLLSDYEILGNAHFTAKTTYPGLLLGSGYLHELPDIEGQVILGFDFDYTTGLPIIRGSSIKGVLRSAFENEEYIKELLNNKEINVKELKKEIFENGDIFFDAVIVNYGTHLLLDDFITPHEKETKNPIPLRFIKVAPNVTFRFDFELSDGIISKQEKIELFKNIIEDLGIGAKTNVGYGKFTDFNNYKTDKEKEEEKVLIQRQKFEDAKNNRDLEKLKQFLIDYPNSTYKNEVEELIKEIQLENEKEEIELKYKNLDKTKRNHIDAFIKKYESNPLAQEYIEELKKLLNNKKGKQDKKSIKDLKTAKNEKEVKDILVNVKINESDYDFIEKEIIRICENLNKKAKNKFFRKINLSKFISKEFEEKLKQKLL